MRCIPARNIEFAFATGSYRSIAALRDRPQSTTKQSVDRLVANGWCPATLFTIVGLAVTSVMFPRTYRDKKRDMACHLIVDSAMKVRCPGCGYIGDKLPPTHKCPKCDEFSHEWLIYDWESFALIKRRHIRYNLLIIGLVLINLLTAITLKSTDAFQWLFNLFLIPAMISLFYCRKQLERKSEYKGHRGRDTLPWFIGFRGL